MTQTDSRGKDGVRQVRFDSVEVEYVGGLTRGT